MDFVRYADRSAGLVNADLGDVARLIHFLDERQWLHAAVVERDAGRCGGSSRSCGRSSRPPTPATSRPSSTLLNALLAKHPVTPYIAGHDAPAGDRWHMHVADRQSSVSEL